VDKGVEDFKTKNKLTDITTEAGLDLQSNAELQQRIIELNSQMKMVEYIQTHIRNNKEALIPANLGIKDAATNNNTSVYNRLLLERNRIIKSSSKMNPTVINLDAQLATLRQSIEQSLVNLKSSLSFSLSEARNHEYRINSKRKVAPKQEREFQDIKRKQQIIESLYLYLLKKREENAISLGIPVPNAKIIDKADGSNLPVSPKPMLVYLIGAVLGLLTPFAIISVQSLLDNKVHSYDDVEAAVKAPVIGDIPRNSSKKKVIVSDTSNSNIAESFRLLLTNTNFMLSGVRDRARTIFITSTISGEGKTFVALNLASSLALLNRKVLLIGADIRKPRLANYLDRKPETGLTHYLMDNDLKPVDVIESLKKENFDVIFSGEIPQNPSELLLNGRFEEIIEYGKANYDYVIIDTAPVNMVTDTLLLGHYADLFIYVVRAEFLDKRLLKIAQTMYENKRLPNMTVLINDADYEKQGYGYGYGYGYGNNERKPWYKRVFG
jgi:capsular exopolysaccharide synthesis family protein